MPAPPLTLKVSRSQLISPSSSPPQQPRLLEVRPTPLGGSEEKSAAPSPLEVSGCMGVSSVPVPYIMPKGDDVSFCCRECLWLTKEKKKEKKEKREKKMCTKRAGIARLVERRIEKPGVMLRWVRVSCAVRFFSPTSQLSVQTLTVSLQPPCAIACINICLHVKNPKRWQPYHCFENTAHTMSLGMGSAALVAAVPCPGNETQISCKGQRSTYLKKKFNEGLCVKISLVDFILNLENNVSDS